MAQPRSYINKYLMRLLTLLNGLDKSALVAFIELLESARIAGAQICFIGNGGSAATASHFANDLGVTHGFRCRSLADNVSVLTAIANDVSYAEVFSYQVDTQMHEGDILVAISASGNSPNVVKAVEAAKAKRIHTVGLTGFSGGKLRELCDICVHTPSEKGEYGPIEDIHMIIDHIVMTYLKESSPKPSSAV